MWGRQWAPFTVADHAAANALMVLLYGSESNARAHGALAPVADVLVADVPVAEVPAAAAVDEEDTKPAVSVKQEKREISVALEVTAVVAGPARAPKQRQRRQRVQRRRWSSSSEEEEEAAVQGDVPIGTGKTIITKEKYEKCRWQNYRFATRSFLDAVFPKSVLSTHSVTGKPSPAFSHLPAKKRLNPIVVKDIVIEVARRYKVPQSAVRAVITTKCADEAKISKNLRLKREAGTQRQKRGRRPIKKPRKESSDEREL